MNDRTFLRVSAACRDAMDRDTKRRAFADKRLRGRRVARQALDHLADTFDNVYVAELARIAEDSDI